MFKQTHGRAIWQMTKLNPTFDAVVNDGLASDSQLIMQSPEIFDGIISLVDVGGAIGMLRSRPSRRRSVGCWILRLSLARLQLVIARKLSVCFC
ncbi:hypothetical protein U9M48_002542 [Paspalum notatum var. saurae]|uniref:O-methyltransferase C-terminal domain-containing protein n=1 Tax=Paspalum notatum var. saurae TaxID=547442 RepID=A0AAQ3SJ53_PASNO